MSTKYVYSFGGGTADGDGRMKDLLGGKGANLAEMCKIGIPVPPGFTITTEVCAAYYDNGKKIPEDAIPQIDEAIKKVEKEAADAGPGHPHAGAQRPGHADDSEQDQVGKGAPYLKPGRPCDLRQGRARHEDGARGPSHEGRKSVRTSTKLIAEGSLTHATCAWSVVAESRRVTLAISPTTRPRG